jgi:hypothetical protein
VGSMRENEQRESIEKRRKKMEESERNRAK